MRLKKNNNNANFIAFGFILFVVVTCSSLSIVTYLNRIGAFAPVWYTAALNNTTRVDGNLFCAIPIYDVDTGLSSKWPFKLGNSIVSPDTNMVQVEAAPYISVYGNNVDINGLTIVSPHDVVIKGGDSFTFPFGSVCILASGGSSPLGNMGAYTLSYPLIVSRNLAKLLYSITTFLWLILVGFVYYNKDIMFSYYSQVLFLIKQSVNKMENIATKNRFIPLTVITLIFAFIVALVYLNEKFLFTPLWLYKPITVINHDQGFSFKGYTGIFEISSVNRRSPAVVIENGIPLSSKNSLHDEIRKTGSGKYSFWEDTVYFSTADNSNPLTNKRDYEIYYPYIIPRIYALCLYAILALLLLVYLSFSIIYHQKLVFYLDNKIDKKFRCLILIVSMSLAALSLFAYAGFPSFFQLGTSLDQSIVQLSTEDSYLVYSTGFLIIALFFLSLTYGIKLLILKNKIPTWYKRFCFVIVTIFLVIYVVGPMRRVGNVILSWNVCYVAPDSDSYIGHYTEYSLRPPLLPLITETLTDIDTVKKERYPAGKPITTSQLIRVVRLQKVLFVFSALCLALTLMSIVDPFLIVIFYLLLINVNAFNVEYSSIILSESITQSLLIFLLSVFFYFTKRMNSSALLLAGPLFSLMVLTRPAAIYAGVFVLIMMFCSLKLRLRHCWKNVIVSVLLMVGLIGAPILHRYLKTGYLTPAGMYVSAKITFALYFANISDIDIMPTQEKKLFLKKALELREKQDVILRQYYKSEKDLIHASIVSVLYDIKTLGTVAIAPYSAIAVLPEGSNIERSKITQEVSHILLRKHWYEYAVFITRQFIDAANVTLIEYPLVFILWICFVIIALMCKKNKLLLAYIATGIAHFVHLVVIVSNDLPTIRYIKATEFLLFVSLLLLLYSIVSKFGFDFFKLTRGEPIEQG